MERFHRVVVFAGLRKRARVYTGEVRRRRSYASAYQRDDDPEQIACANLLGRQNQQERAARDAEPRDTGWADQMEQLLRMHFATQLTKHPVEQLEIICRTSFCQIKAKGKSDDALIALAEGHGRRGVGALGKSAQRRGRKQRLRRPLDRGLHANSPVTLPAGLGSAPCAAMLRHVAGCGNASGIVGGSSSWTALARVVAFGTIAAAEDHQQHASIGVAPFRGRIALRRAILAEADHREPRRIHARAREQVHDACRTRRRQFPVRRERRAC